MLNYTSHRQSRKQDGNKYYEPCARVRGQRTRERGGAPGLTGWNALLRPMLDRLALAALLSLLAVAFIAVLLKGLTGQDAPGLLLIAAVPPAALAIVTQGQIPARALAGLPLTPLARAVALQTIAPLMQIPVFALMCALMAVTAPGALTPAWLAAYGVTMLGLLAAASLSAGVNLRFGQKGMALMVGVLGMIVGLASGYMAARHEAHPAAGSGVTAPAAALLLILPLVAGWVWTWAELAYGRAAYRHRPPSTPYWRGRGV